MATIHRTESDTATMNRRDMADKTREDSRIKNDEMTLHRRDMADKARNDNRDKNDEMTANRREKNDGYPTRTIIIVLVFLLILVAGIYFFT